MRLLLIFGAIFFIGCLRDSMQVKKEKLSTKPYLYYIHRKGCPACVYMDRVLSLQDIKNIVNKNYKLVTVDVYNQENLPLKSMFTNKTPTFYILKNKKIVDKFNALEPSNFKKRLLKNLK